ncbi:hypothetical protein TrispH2_007359 [Trichoplax sp. H2]|nr:hypothetical protein TrispH2_007359 [Trichoplax sp. H2]|eukprot:RDD41466.1 hypothetical protein TrispH2_007359 [Trichoplax sp. H2]
MGDSIPPNMKALRQEGIDLYLKKDFTQARLKFQLIFEEMKVLENQVDLAQFRHSLNLDLADTCVQLEQYQQAFEYAETATRIGNSLQDQVRIAEGLDKQGEVKQKLKRSHEDILSDLMKSLQLKSKVKECDGLKLARTYDLLGVENQKNGKFKEALLMFERSLNAKLNAIGCDSEEVGDSYALIGHICDDLGKYLSSDGMYRLALGIYATIFPEHHPKTISAYDGVINARVKLRKFDDALELKQTVDKLRQKARKSNECFDIPSLYSLYPLSQASPSKPSSCKAKGSIIGEIIRYNTDGVVPVPLIPQQHGGVMIHPKFGEITGFFHSKYFLSYWAYLHEGNCRSDGMRIMLLGSQSAGKSFIAKLLSQDEIMKDILSQTPRVTFYNMANIAGYYPCEHEIRKDYRRELDKKTITGMELIQQSAKLESIRTALVKKANPDAKNGFVVWDPNDEEKYKDSKADAELHNQIQSRINAIRQQYVTVWHFGWRAHQYLSHQPFMPVNGIYILVFNLAQEMDEEVQTRDGYPTSMTYRSVMREWVFSIVDGYPTKKRINVKIGVTHHQLALPIILLVASHGDLIENQDIRRHHFKQFKSNLLSILPSDYKQHIFSTDIIFNCNPDDKSQNAIQERQQCCHQLHKFITVIANCLPFITNPVPIRWYITAAILRLAQDDNVSSSRPGGNQFHGEEVNKIMLLSQVCDMVKNYGIYFGEEDVQNMLLYLHDIGIILYYPNGDDGIVITAIDWYLGILRAFIILDGHRAQNLTIKRCFYNARQAGILEENCIDSVVVRFGAAIFKELIIKSMEMADIICEIKNPDCKDDQRRYFAPQLLDVQAHDFNLSRYQVSEWLYVGYDSQDITYLADGVYDCFLTKFVKEWKNVDVELRDRCAKFYLQDDRYFILIKKQDCHIALRYFYEPSKPSSTNQLDEIKLAISEKRPQNFIREKLEAAAKQRIYRLRQYKCQFYLKCNLCQKLNCLGNKSQQQEISKDRRCSSCKMQFNCQSLIDWSMCN